MLPTGSRNMRPLFELVPLIGGMWRVPCRVGGTDNGMNSLVVTSIEL